MDVPQLKGVMLHKKRMSITCIMNVNSSAQRVRKLTVREGTCLEEEGVTRQQPSEHSVSSLDLEPKVFQDSENYLYSCRANKKTQTVR